MRAIPRKISRKTDGRSFASVAAMDRSRNENYHGRSLSRLGIELARGERMRKKTPEDTEILRGTTAEESVIGRSLREAMKGNIREEGIGAANTPAKIQADSGQLILRPKRETHLRGKSRV